MLNFKNLSKILLVKDFLFCKTSVNLIPEVVCSCCCWCDGDRGTRQSCYPWGGRHSTEETVQTCSTSCGDISLDDGKQFEELVSVLLLSVFKLHRKAY